MSLLNSINIGAAGLDAHGKRLDIHAKNIANIDTPNYVRKIPVLKANEDISFNSLLGQMKDSVFSSGSVPFSAGGVSFTGVVEDPSQGEMIYKPGHPDADENGYIRSSNVNPLVDMADASLTSKAYEASLSIISISKAMAQRAVEIGK